MPGYYKLVGHETVPISMEEYATSFNGSREVAKTEVGDIRVSTFFLAIDHRYGDGGGPPALFETMVLGGKLDKSCHRYSTWDQAVAGHKETVNEVRFSEGLDMVDMYLGDGPKEKPLNRFEILKAQD